MTNLMDLFWTEEVWLPPNVSWADLSNYSGNGKGEVNYRKFSDLLIPVFGAFVVIALRFLAEKYLFRPFGKFLGLKESVRRPPATNDVLEGVYQQGLRITRNQIESNASKLGMSVRQVERWIRQRRIQDKPTTLEKFSETGWRWLYYSAVFAYGMAVLWNKSWLWDIKHCWYNYPYHSVERDVWWYYMIELSFYWALCISQFWDVKRKDFFQMFIHHVTTIALMSFSWTCNLTRVGTLVLVVHDCADIFLEAAKMCKYTNYQKMCDSLFACFAITWIITRLGVYPTHILYSTTIEAAQIVQMFPAYYIFNVLLSVLLILHVFWTYYIMKIVYKAIYSGKAEDLRSDSDDDPSLSDSDGQSAQNGKTHNN